MIDNMKLTILWEFFQERILDFVPTNAFQHLFNPYNNLVEGMDRCNAVQIRRDNLYNYLNSFSRQPKILAVGEAAGYRGCRFSGVPFTSEDLLASNRLPFKGCATSLRKQPYKEATATIFWRVMQPHHPDFIVWNCVPFHPHHPTDPLTNRKPSPGELRYFAPLLAEVVRLLDPALVIAIGRSAQKTLANLEIVASAVRHPSHGGANDFATGINQLLKQ